ncbi:hypothetical protein [Algoriphagus formosus]|uniref:hypothetical protein n=1 Tax=Algoriphagus formosus TaxID=2007308 RepID=UPI003F726F4D
MIKVVFKGIKQLSYKERIFASPILIIGIMAMSGNSKIQENPSTMGPGSNFEMKNITVPYSNFNKINVTYYIHKETGLIDHVNSDSILTGFVFGREWRHFNVSETDLGLELQGSIQYSLLGIKVFGGGIETIALELKNKDNSLFKEAFN